MLTDTGNMLEEADRHLDIPEEVSDRGIMDTGKSEDTSPASQFEGTKLLE